MDKDPKNIEPKIEDANSDKQPETTSDNSNNCEYDDWHSDFSIS